jgi:hypothetical protein
LIAAGGGVACAITIACARGFEFFIMVTASTGF